MNPGTRLYHWKGGEYAFIETALHTETDELMAVYQDDEYNTFVRPMGAMFDVVLDADGNHVNRFTWDD